MRDNPLSTDAAFFDLPDFRILALEGRDASVFAHAQFMNDVAMLAEGHWQWNGWLNPKGRVIALFALLKLDAQTVWLVLPDADPSDLAIALQRFVFRSKVILAPQTQCKVTGTFAAPKLARHSIFHDVPMHDGRCVELDMGAEGGARTVLIRHGRPVPCEVDNKAMPALTARWAALDLRHGLPRLVASQAEQWTPQQLSLDRLDAYSVQKGCYPGQEIVARTHFLGKVKRGLMLFEASEAVPAGVDVVDGERPIGTAVCSTTNDIGAFVLAVLPLDCGTADLHAGGLALTARPLWGGLAR